MRYRAGSLGYVRPADILFVGLWVVVFVIAMILQAIPVFLVVMIFALALGAPTGVALTVIPIAFVAMVYLCCVIASKFTKRRAAAMVAERPRPRFRTVPEIAPAKDTTSPADRYRMKRFG